MEEDLIIVDSKDNAIGTAKKMAIHQQGLLHRAFSVFIFDRQGRLLLQRRAYAKYHSGGLWSNSCCGHPRPDEPTGKAAERRLYEEMGFSCPLTWAFSFTYTAHVAEDLVENEFDHVYIGAFDGIPHPAPAEVAEWRWIEQHELVDMLAERPESFSAWFKIILDMFQPAALFALAK